MDDSEIQALDSLEAGHWWYRNRKKILSELLSKELRSMNVLDLGSASGSNTIFMNELGFRSVSSVEYSDYGCKLQRIKGIDVINADARQLPFAAESYDYVVCMDVIEHIEDDISVLNEIRRVLKRNGKAIISVPEDMKLWSNHDLAVGHFRRYSKKELESKVISCGLRPEVTFSSHSLLKPAIRFFRKFSKGSDLRRVNLVLNFVLGVACVLERKLGLTRFSGTTLWVLIHRET